MTPLPDRLTIGELARRSGLTTSALRFYESRGLISAERTPGNQRLFHRATLRRLGVIRAAAALGLSLTEIGEALADLPERRAPTRTDWEHLSRTWRERLDQQIAAMETLRDKLSGCIGCGCLSMEVCALFNTEDSIAGNGSGARYLLGDAPHAGRVDRPF